MTSHPKPKQGSDQPLPLALLKECCPALWVSAYTAIPGAFYFHSINKYFRGHASGRYNQPFVPLVNFIFVSTEGRGAAAGSQPGLNVGCTCQREVQPTFSWIHSAGCPSEVYRGEGRRLGCWQWRKQSLFCPSQMPLPGSPSGRPGYALAAPACERRGRC